MRSISAPPLYARASAGRGAPVDPPAGSLPAPPLAPGWIALVPALGALAICSVPLLWAGHLEGVIGYDDGVYVGAALALAHGVVPYRDFVMVQPPGIAVLLLPVTLVAHGLGLSTATVTAICRVLTAVVTAATCGLVSLLLRHRGVLAMLVGGATLAACPIAYTAFSSTMLEPYLNLLTLGGIALMFSRGELTGGWRLYLGGLAIGLACGVKLWAVIPAGLGLWWSLSRRGDRASYFAGGVTSGVALFYVPFLVAAPGGLVRDVFFAQANRLNLRGLGLGRLAELSGLKFIHVGLGALVVPAAVAAAAAALVLAGERGTALPGRSLDRYAAAGAVVIVVLLLLGDPFYSHYAYVLAPWLALLVGSGAERTCAAIVVLSNRRRWRLTRQLRPLLTVSVVAATAALTVVVASRELAHAESINPGGRYAAGVAAVARLPESSCIETDQVSVLLSANRLSYDTSACPIVVDADGIRLAAISRLGDSGRTENALAQQWQRRFEHARYVYLSSRFRLRIAWPQWLRRWFHREFVRVRLPRHRAPLGQLYRRRA